MVAKLTWASILSIVMIPLFAVGWLDPLEGSIALIPGIAIAIVVRLISRVPFTRWTWIPFVVVAGLMIITLVLASIQWPAMMASQQAGGDSAANPMTGELVVGGFPVTIGLMWLSRIAEIPMVAGLVYYTIRLCRALVAARKGH